MTAIEETDESMPWLPLQERKALYAQLREEHTEFVLQPIVKHPLPKCLTLTGLPTGHIAPHLYSKQAIDVVAAVQGVPPPEGEQPVEEQDGAANVDAAAGAGIPGAHIIPPAPAPAPALALALAPAPAHAEYESSDDDHGDEDFVP